MLGSAPEDLVEAYEPVLAFMKRRAVCEADTRVFVQENPLDENFSRLATVSIVKIVCVGLCFGTITEQKSPNNIFSDN